jgi:sulfite exporter TauE/SafE/copper chaperone CopZ
MPKKIYAVPGMHCRSCELLIEDKLKTVANVDRVSAKHSRGVVEIFYREKEPDQNQIKTALAEAGYPAGEKTKPPFINKDAKAYRELFLAILIFFAFYLIFRAFNFSGFNFASAGINNLAVVLLVGLTAGISTCMALVGGLVLALSARHAERFPTASAGEKFQPHLFFNLGRILSYTLLGGFVGLVGGIFSLSNFMLGILTIVIAIAMLIMGVQLLDIFPRWNKFKITLPKFLARGLKINGEPKTYRPSSAILLGALSFFLPCGFTQAMQLLALGTGNFLAGAAIMGVFALGTTPGILGLGGLTAFARGKFARYFFKFAGVAVIFFALFNFGNGLKLTGINLNETTNPADNQTVKVENGVQVVNMIEKANGYSPARIVVKKRIKVRWIIDAAAPYSCASTLVSDRLNLRLNLKPGENIIEFTPPDTGRINFSCGMGMYSGYFEVVE